MSSPDAAANEAECKCDCNRNTWANVMCGLGIGAGGFITAVSIISLIAIPDVPTFLLCVFMSVFGLVIIVAELRRFKAIRGLLWHVVKFVYFITAYTGRGLFLFFCGTLLFDPNGGDNKLLNIIAAIYCVVVGIMLIIINLIYKLPVYLDPQMMKLEMEARMKEEAEAKAAAVYEQKLAAEKAAMQQANNASAAANNAASNAAATAHATVNMGGNSSDAPPYSPPHLS